MILVIDDNEMIRFTIKEICDHGGWNSIEAENGQEGVEIFKKIKPNLVLVDYHMPALDGVRTVREIRKLDSSVPIIVLTVEESNEVAEKFFHAGATDFALKPIKAPDLISRIRINLKMAQLQKDHKSAFVDKGINSATMQSIKSFMVERNKALTINEIQKALPIAYQTVHRYLNHLVEVGEVQVTSHYGKKGRPKNMYMIR